MTAPIPDDFTELTDFQVDAVSLVKSPANGVNRFLIAKSGQGGLVDPDLIRDLISKSNPTLEMESTMSATHSTAGVSIGVPARPSVRKADVTTMSHQDLVTQATSGSAAARQEALAELGRRTLAGATSAAGVPEPSQPQQPVATVPPSASPVSGADGDDLTPAPSSAAGTDAAEVAKMAAVLRGRPGVQSDAEALVLARAHVAVAMAEAAPGATPQGVALVRMRATSDAVRELTRLRSARA